MTHNTAVTTHRNPSRRSVALYWAARATLRQIYRIWPLTDSGIAHLAAVEAGLSRLPHPRGVTINETVLGSIPVETTRPLTSSADAPADTAVLYLHGGGFVFCGPGTHRRLCARLATQLDVPVHSVRYRGLPETDLAGVVDDAYVAYQALSDSLPEHANVVVAGDSAGGYLALKICELAALKGHKRPAAVVAHSPLVDLTADMRDGPWSTRDAYQPASTVSRLQRRWASAAASMPGSRSLLDCDPDAFPPTLITLAAGELLEGSAMILTRRLVAANRHVITHRWPSAVHAFPVLDHLTPESREATRLTIAFLRDTLRLTTDPRTPVRGFDDRP